MTRISDGALYTRGAAANVLQADGKADMNFVLQVRLGQEER